MKVIELIRKLSQFDPNLEVVISDGYDCVFYHTKDIEITEFKEDNEKPVVDIGIGGCKEE